MSNSKQTQQTWNKVASQYESKFMHLDLYNESYNEFCNLINSNARILDVGCGPGNITKYLLSKNSNFSILGIDYAPNMIKFAKKNNPKAEFKLINVNDLHIINEKFDGIISGFQLPYLNNIERVIFFNNCNILLNINGFFYLSFVQGKFEDSHLQTGSTGDSLFFYYHELEKISNELKNLNLSIIKKIEIQYPLTTETFQKHTILIIKK